MSTRVLDNQPDWCERLENAQHMHHHCYRGSLVWELQVKFPRHLTKRERKYKVPSGMGRVDESRTRTKAFGRVVSFRHISGAVN